MLGEGTRDGCSVQGGGDAMLSQSGDVQSQRDGKDQDGLASENHVDPHGQDAAKSAELARLENKRPQPLDCECTSNLVPWVSWYLALFMIFLHPQCMSHHMHTVGQNTHI